MEPKVTFPFSKIDFALLLNQKDKLVELRTQYPDGSDTFELLSGVIHLLDFIGDTIHESVDKYLVYIYNYDECTGQFICSSKKCPKEYRSLYQSTVDGQDNIRFFCLEAVPAFMFSDNIWAYFQRYGLNQEFKVPQETESENK